MLESGERGITSMKKARSLLPMLLLFIIPVTGQVEHATTPEQCRADADAWDIPTRSALAPNEDAFRDLAIFMVFKSPVPTKTMDARIAEFDECIKTDGNQANRYSQAGRAYTSAKLGRMASFMQRHNLMEQFYQEDDQGKR
jgi:hypothetical protein